MARISNLALLASGLFAWLALRRYATFHNETFDLAFYARLVWGLGHGDHYQPLTGSYFWGLHASPILFVFGQLGRVFAIVPLLLTVQAASVGAAAIPLARIATRRIGHPFAADLTLVAYLLYPTVASIATYEFHPSALALFPLAQALDYLDRREVRRGVAALAVALLCREDVALVVAITGISIALRREDRIVGAAVFAGAFAWAMVYIFVIAPHGLPRHGSLELHYGHLGGSPAAIASTLVHHPIATLRSLATPVRLLYAPRLLAPLAFLPLLAPRWLLPATVPVAINVLSQFPTATQIQSHYAALTVPFLFASAAHGAGRLAALRPGAVNRYVLLVAFAVGAGTLWMQHGAGATPLSRRWNANVFRRDEQSVAYDQIVRRVPPLASVSAPDAVLPHLAARPLLERIAVWRHPYDYAIVTTAYRARFGATQDLWRSSEETAVRNALSGDEYGVEDVVGTVILFRHGAPVRAWARGRYIDVPTQPNVHADHREIGSSLVLAGWGLEPQGPDTLLTLLVVPSRPWPADLAFEAAYGPLHPVGDRLDPATIVSVLAFDGLFSPVHVRVGEVACERVLLPADERTVLAQGLYFGVRRIDGSRLDPASAHWTRLAQGP